MAASGEAAARRDQTPEHLVFHQPNDLFAIMPAGFDHTHCVAGCLSQDGGPIGAYDGWLRYGVQAETRF